jgi:hypothetical protein
MRNNKQYIKLGRKKLKVVDTVEGYAILEEVLKVQILKSCGCAPPPFIPQKIRDSFLNNKKTSNFVRK